MQQITVDQLNLVRLPKTISTVEVDLDSLSVPSEFEHLISIALEPFASKNSNSVSTIYLYSCESVNFRVNTWSIFIGVRGAKILVEILFKIFESLPGVRVGRSRYAAE